MRRTMDSLPPLNVPKKPIGVATTTGLVDLDHYTHKQHGELNQMLREVGRLQKVNFVVIFLNKPPYWGKEVNSVRRASFIHPLVISLGVSPSYMYS